MTQRQEVATIVAEILNEIHRLNNELQEYMTDENIELLDEEDKTSCLYVLDDILSISDDVLIRIQKKYDEEHQLGDNTILI